jgi:hypothetical protein
MPSVRKLKKIFIFFALIVVTYQARLQPTTFTRGSLRAEATAKRGDTQVNTGPKTSGTFRNILREFISKGDKIVHIATQIAELFDTLASNTNSDLMDDARRQELTVLGYTDEQINSKRHDDHFIDEPIVPGSRIIVPKLPTSSGYKCPTSICGGPEPARAGDPYKATE